MGLLNKFFGLAASASLMIASTGAAQTPIIEREDLSRYMGSADTCFIDDGNSVRRAGAGNLRDCFDKTRETAARSGHALGDAYKHGRAVRSFECRSNEASEVACIDVRVPQRF